VPDAVEKGRPPKGLSGKSGGWSLMRRSDVPTPRASRRHLLCAPALGATIEFLTSHCDPTVNLSAFHVVHGEAVIGVWPIRARY